MKKQNNRMAYIRLISLAYVSALSSCVYHLPEEDWERNGKVRLHLEWQGGSGNPSAMTYHFYKEGSDRPVVRTGSASGYEGTLPSGRYRVAACNADADNVVLEMDRGYEGAGGSVRRLSALKSTAVHIAHPDNLYGAGSGWIEVGGKETAVEELYPSALVKTLDLNIKIVRGEEAAAPAETPEQRDVPQQRELPQRSGILKQSGIPELLGLSGRLTGVSSRIHIPSGRAEFETPAFLLFEPGSSGTGVYASSLRLFGLSDGGEGGNEPVELFLTLRLKDGKEITSCADITSEASEAFTHSVSAHVVLDLELAYDAIEGARLVLTGWKDGTGEAGN